MLWMVSKISFAIVRVKPIPASTVMLIEALSLNALSEKIVVLIELSRTIAKQKRTMVVELTLFANMLDTSNDNTGTYLIWMSLKWIDSKRPDWVYVFSTHQKTRILFKSGDSVLINVQNRRFLLWTFYGEFVGKYINFHVKAAQIWRNERVRCAQIVSPCVYLSILSQSCGLR